MKKVIVALAALLVVASSCSRNGETRTPRETKLIVNEADESFYLVHDGKKRTGVMHLPAGYDGSIPCSLVFALHGKGMTGARFRELGFDEYADRYNFIMVYPDAIAGIWEIYPGITGANDDVAFFKKMLKGLAKKYRIEPSRVYVTGHSMGGYMTYRLAHDLPGTFSAMAPVAGLSVVFGKPEARGPISLLHLHAADDWTVKVGAQTDTDVSSARDSVLEWKLANGIDAAYRESPVKGGGIEKTWSGKDGVEVTYRLYAHGGHAWPRDATQTIADFFYTHTARENRVSFRDAERPLLRASTDVVPIEALVEKPELSERVELVRRGEVVASRTEPPYVFDYRPEMNTSERLYARVRRKGSAVSSSDFFRIVTTPENLARAATASSGESEQGLPPSAAVDGDLSTRWGSGFSDDQYLQIDLGEPNPVRGVSLFWEKAYATRFAIEVSTDAIRWKRVFERESGGGGNEFVEFPPVEARFVRLAGIKRASPYGYSLYEMMVH
jgi:poly(3-hydroxybutyrate) depolymerase